MKPVVSISADILYKMTQTLREIREYITEDRRDALSNKLAYLLDRLMIYKPCCPKCGGLMSIKGSIEYGSFYGCKNFPECSGTLSCEQAVEDIFDGCKNLK